MKLLARAFPLTAVCSAVALLAACGGGGGDAAAVPTDGSTGNLSTRVIDGAIANALVCLDKNVNSLCDEGEPSGRTAADGTVTLKIAPEDAGKFPVLALIGTDATDADHGAVTQPFALSAPAANTAAITPLSTLVATAMQASRETAAQAEARLRAVLGVNGALLGDFTQGEGADVAPRRSLARLLVLAQQKARAAVAAGEGRTDASGATLTAARLSQLAQQRVHEDLQALVALLGSAEVRAAQGPGAADEALRAQVDSYAAEHYALATADEVVALANARQELSSPVAEVAGPPQGGVSLRWFSYADPGNWNYRLFKATAEQNTPNAQGLRRFTEERKKAENGQVLVWGVTPGYTSGNYVWTGSEWFVCPTDYEHTAMPVNAKGESSSTYCRAYQDASQRAARDIGGRLMSEVVAEVRAYPIGRDSAGERSTWGPSPDDARIASLRFPAGSKLWIYRSTNLSTPDGYNPVDEVKVYNAAVAAGGSSAGAACGQVTAANFENFRIKATSLEQLVANNPGKPCVYGGGARNEWWNNGSLTLIEVPAAVNDPAYLDRQSIRVGFGSGQTATFFRCPIDAGNSSSRNCDPIGSTTYTIETLGDGRVLRFADLPAETASLTYTKIFVERGGKVFHGYHNKPVTSVSLRTDSAATDALFNALGVTR